MAVAETRKQKAREELTLAEAASTLKRPSTAGALLSKSSCSRSRTRRKPSTRELTGGPSCWRPGQRKTDLSRKLTQLGLRVQKTSS